jgi:hypothetical protein
MHVRGFIAGPGSHWRLDYNVETLRIDMYGLEAEALNIVA